MPYARSILPSGCGDAFSEPQPGMHAVVEALAPPGQEVATLHLMKRLGVDKGLTQHEASILIDELARYRRQLTRHSVPLAPLESVEVTRVGGEWQVWAIEAYVEGATVSGARESKDLLKHLSLTFTLVCDLVGKLPDTRYRHPVGVAVCATALDFKPTNVIISRDSLVLVDTFPPLRLKRGAIVEGCLNRKLHKFSYEKLLFVTGTRIGMMSRFLWLMLDDVKRVHGRRAAKAAEAMIKSRLLSSDCLEPTLAQDVAAQLLRGFPLLSGYYRKI
jgi:hypothetical protein